MKQQQPGVDQTAGIRFDAGTHARAKIGYVILATEQTVADDVYRLLPKGVGVHFARVPMPDSITVETLAAQAEHLSTAAATLLPDGTLDVICYACTSGSLVIGEERVFHELKAGAPHARATSLITGVIRALNAFGVSRIAIATPYLDEVNRREVDYLRYAGFETVSIQGMNLERDSDMIRVAPDFIREFSQAVDRTEAEAVLISCSALRALDIVDELEQILGKLVITSNQAMIWDTLRLAGIHDKVDGYGRLFREF